MLSGLKSKSVRNVITLMSGTAIAQAIPIAISPILTRLYSPEDFGVLALYLSITSIISIIATGRYELAITLPEKDEDAIQIVWLACILTILVSASVFVIVLFFGSYITSLLQNEKIQKWLYFIPLTVFFSGVYSTFKYWHNRKKKYSVLSKGRVVQTFNTGAINLGIGAINKGGVGGLVFGNLIGQFLSSLYMGFVFFKNDRQNIEVRKSKIKELAKRYSNFPRYDVMASFFNISANQLTHVFFNMFFGAITSGYYFLTQKIFTMPITLIAGAIQDVFKMEMIEVYLANGDTRRLYLKTLKRLVLLSILPTILIYFVSIDLFVLVFGVEWKPAGEFVQIMTPIFFLRFISFPLSYMVYIAEKQVYNSRAQFLLLLVILASFLICKEYSAKIMVQLLTLVFSLFYTGYIIVSYSLTSTGQVSINKEK